MDAFREWVDLAGLLMEGAGVAVMVFGALFALVLVVTRRGRGREGAYRRFRQDMGRAILLGLELLVAADIIRTVAVTPTFESVGVLALIVLIRTFLSWSLELEITGRWPWQKAAEAAEPAAGPGVAPAVRDGSA